jgi:acyl-coenzyme A synthetase/AMP-(fatty) acid ligase
MASERICGNIIIGYGNTELGSIAQYRYDAADYVPGKVGKVLGDVEMALADGDGRPVAHGDVGHIRIRRRNADAVTGYVSAGATGDSSRFTEDGWFVPGDLGVMDAKGNLTLAGRDDDVINASGNKFSIDLIESVIEEKTGCRCAVVRREWTGGSEQLVVVIDSARPVRRSDLLTLTAARFPRLEISQIYVVPEIKTTDAKKDRSTLARLLATEPTLFRPL